jgi:DNA-binding FrmR family transcriptional regulator
VYLPGVSHLFRSGIHRVARRGARHGQVQAILRMIRSSSPAAPVTDELTALRSAPSSAYGTLLSLARRRDHLGDVESRAAEKLLHDVSDSLDPHHIDRAERV